MSELQRRMGQAIFEAIAPALIMLLTGSLFWFCAEVVYYGQLLGRLQIILGWWVLGSVLVCRIAVTEGKERSVMFGLPLAILVWIAMMKFVEINGFLGNFAAVIHLAFILASWWCASKLVWDCTVVDSSRDTSSQGLLGRVRIDRQFGIEDEKDDEDEILGATDEEQPDAKPNIFQQIVRLGRKHNTPGLAVVYFSLAAIPIFGFGQGFIPAGDVESRQFAFKMFVVYMSAALGLLLTTSLLSLQQYLFRRDVAMPNPVAITWVATGLVAIIVVLAATWILPRPYAEYSIGESPIRFESPQDLESNRHAMIGDDGPDDQDSDRVNQNREKSGSQVSKDGKEKSNQGNNPDSKNEQGGGKDEGESQSKSQSKSKQQSKQSSDSKSKSKEKSESKSSEKGKQGNKQKGDSGEKGESKKGEGEKSKKSDSKKSDSKQSDAEQNDASKNESKENNSEESSKQEDSSKEKSDDDNSKDSDKNDAEKSDQKKSDEQKDASQNRDDERDQKDSEQRDDKTKSKQQKQKQRQVRLNPTLGSLFTIIKWLFYIAVSIVAIFFAWKFRKRIAQAWKEFIEELKAFFARLFAGKQKPQQQTAAGELLATSRRHRSFAEFADPFASGQSQSMSPEDLAKYCFAAFQAWAADHGVPRDPDQTPIEFAAIIGDRQRRIRREAKSIAEIYSAAVYSNSRLSSNVHEKLKHIWRLMETTDIPPLPQSVDSLTGSTSVTT